MRQSGNGRVMDYLGAGRLDGKVAAITGGASGIGLEAARALGSCGAKVVLLDRDRDGLTAASASLSRGGAEVDVCPVDVCNASEVGDAAKRLGAVDILVNSAGTAKLHGALDVQDEDWLHVIDVNLNGTFWCCRAFGRSMVERGSGSIINLGSMSGDIVNRPQFASSYMASKAAVHHLTRALAVEWAKTGVRVNAVAPGYIATEMTLGMRSRPELFDTWLDMTPMGRCGEPHEVAAVILFLASPASSFMTGSVVAVDGGYTCF